MRAPPAPTLQNVLVSHPSTPHNAVATPDDLLAAAVLAADETHDLSRPRSMLARVTRRWARLSDSLWRRRSSSRRDLTTATPSNPLVALRLQTSRSTPNSRQVVSPPVITFEPSQRGPFHASADDIHNPRPPISQCAEPEPQPNDDLDDTVNIPPAPEFEPGKSQVVLSRERQLRAKRRQQMLAFEHAADDDMLDELTVSSGRDAAPLRVRQVGARDDDDTLLLLPRVASVSFTSPSRQSSANADRVTSSTTANVSPGKSLDGQPRPTKVRQLPRGSALMPMRSSRAPVVELASPVSSAGKASRAGSDSGGSDAVSSEARRNNMYAGLQQRLSYDVEFDNNADADDEVYSSDEASTDSDDDVGQTEASESEDDVLGEDDSDVFEGWEGAVGQKRHICRLPTGMSKRDVEREMERAVVEIASDGAESENGEDSVAVDSEVVSSTRISASRWRESVNLREVSTTRSRSDAHDKRPVEAGFVRRASSSMQSGKALVSAGFIGQAAVAPIASSLASGGGGNGGGSGDKGRFSRTQDVALFEDDYLSFQGFHGNGNDGRSYYSGMSSLLRSKRISSVTDSVSDESDEGAVRGRSESSRRNKGLRSGRLPLLMRKWSITDDKKVMS